MMITTKTWTMILKKTPAAISAAVRHSVAAIPAATGRAIATAEITTEAIWVPVVSIIMATTAIKAHATWATTSFSKQTIAEITTLTLISKAIILPTNGINTTNRMIVMTPMVIKTR